jgi:cytochrome P460
MNLVHRNVTRFCVITAAASAFALAVVVAAFPGSGRAEETRPPVYVTKIPPGYRDWKLVSVAQERGELDDIRAVLGNEKAIKAFRAAKLPFPDGAIIARIAWEYLPSEENNKVFSDIAKSTGRTPPSGPQSFVAGPPKNGVQFMVKDAKKYAATGGWGYAQFDDGKPADEAVMKSCFPCHELNKTRDGVFTRYAP